MDTRLVNLALEYADAPVTRWTPSRLKTSAPRTADASDRSRTRFVPRAREGETRRRRSDPRRRRRARERTTSRASYARASGGHPNSQTNRGDRGDQTANSPSCSKAGGRRWSRLRTAPSFGKNGAPRAADAEHSGRRVDDDREGLFLAGRDCYALWAAEIHRTCDAAREDIDAIHAAATRARARALVGRAVPRYGGSDRARHARCLLEERTSGVVLIAEPWASGGGSSSSTNASDGAMTVSVRYKENKENREGPDLRRCARRPRVVFATPSALTIIIPSSRSVFRQAPPPRPRHFTRRDDKNDRDRDPRYGRLCGGQSDVGTRPHHRQARVRVLV